ncbi:hypothetical protein BDF22DRAFT_688804 [Syncephalis plumigaleata]|nr:hypothetical protein BDF22DRAFT_688804 [Syncephalis plumigaleata]
MDTQKLVSFSISNVITTAAIDAASVLSTATNAMLNAVKPSASLYELRDSIAMKSKGTMDQTTEDNEDVDTLASPNDDGDHDSSRYTPLSPSNLYEAASKLSRAAEAATNGEDEIACAHYRSALASTLAAATTTTTTASDNYTNWYSKAVHMMPNVKPVHNDMIAMHDMEQLVYSDNGMRYRESNVNRHSSPSIDTDGSLHASDTSTPQTAVSLGQAITDVMVALAILIRQSPIPSACQAILAYLWQMLVQLEAKWNLRGQAMQGVIYLVNAGIELDRKHHLMARLGHIATGAISAVATAVKAYNDTAPYNERAKRYTTGESVFMSS